MNISDPITRYLPCLGSQATIIFLASNTFCWFHCRRHNHNRHCHLANISHRHRHRHRHHDLVGELCNCERPVLLLRSRDEGRKAGHKEVQPSDHDDDYANHQSKPTSLNVIIRIGAINHPTSPTPSVHHGASSVLELDAVFPKKEPHIVPVSPWKGNHIDGQLAHVRIQLAREPEK